MKSVPGTRVTGSVALRIVTSSHGSYLKSKRANARKPVTAFPALTRCSAPHILFMGKALEL